MAKLKLSILQNAMHTLHHAIEHLGKAGVEQKRDEQGRHWDEDDHTVSWRNEHGHLCFMPLNFGRLPHVFELKFALLHLVQAAELLLKAYVQKCDPDSILVQPGSKKTIQFRAALDYTLERNPTLFSRDQIDLLRETKNFRNAIEHHEFVLDDAALRSRCIDFLAVCALISQSLLSVNLVEEFSWDGLGDQPDKAVEHLGTVLLSASYIGGSAARKAGELFVAANPGMHFNRCWSCGAKAVSSNSALCMGCGAEEIEELSGLGDWLEVEARLHKLRMRRNANNTD